MQRSTQSSALGSILIWANGLTVREPNGGRRWYHGACGEVVLADCRVPADHLLPGVMTPTDADGRRAAQLAALNLGIGGRLFQNQYVSYRLDLTNNLVVFPRFYNIMMLQLAAALNFGATE